MTDQERYERARKRVKRLREFYGHLGTYMIVMVVLFIVDYSDRGNWWVYWPALGWGIAVVLQAFRVFGPGAGSKWEQRRMDQFMGEDESDDV
jgi:fatty acid desaturase